MKRLLIVLALLGVSVVGADAAVAQSPCQPSCAETMALASQGSAQALGALAPLAAVFAGFVAARSRG